MKKIAKTILLIFAILGIILIGKLISEIIKPIEDNYTMEINNKLK